MKKHFFILLVTFISLQLFAQPTTAEDFTVTDIDGVEYNLYSILDEGKYVYLDFWFSTCGGCIGAVPGLNDIYEGFGCNEYELIVIAMGSEATDAIAETFREEHGCIYPLVSGEGGSYSVISYYEVEYYPEFVLISPDHSVTWNDDDNDLHEISVIASLGPNQNACPDAWPIADFNGAPLVLPVETGVIYNDLSINDISTWNWEFEGGTPSTYSGETPPEIIYNESGWYNVTLTTANAFGNSNSITKPNYVQVYDIADTLPEAWFAANQITVVAGNTVDFTDLSALYQYEWQWAFEMASPANSSTQNPQDVLYNTVGSFDVQLIVRNSEGYDTCIIENYITVIPDAGDEAPIANFTANSRLIRTNTYVNFVDLSTNIPMTWNWQFVGGDPAYSSFQIEPEGVLYANTGFFDVTLNVSNINGSDVLTKREYIVVYDSFVGTYCDTIDNLQGSEIASAMQINGITGYYGGHNSEHIKMYADYYDYHTYSQVYGVIVPVIDISYASYSSYIRFITWDGADDSPTTILGEEKVYLHDMSGNFFQIILFDEPLEVDGPFYLGYSINYAEGDNFVVGMSPNRGNGGFNTFWVNDGDGWENSVSAYGIAASSGIRPLTCLVGIEDELLQNSIGIYPNPCNEILTINNELLFNQGDFVEIYDNTGKTILMKFTDAYTNSIDLDVSEIASGIYYARIFTQGKLIVEKISIIR